MLFSEQHVYNLGLDFSRQAQVEMIREARLLTLIIGRAHSGAKPCAELPLLLEDNQAQA
jgi:hypothetical protein